MNLGETIYETMIREIKEETKLEIKKENLKIFNIYSGEEQHHIYPNDDEAYFVNIIFETDIYDGEIERDPESYELKFFDVDDLPVNVTKPFECVARDLRAGIKSNCVRGGQGGEKAFEKAVYWARRAADQGDRDGQCDLAWLYENASGVERDMEQAAFWYRQAALRGHTFAIGKCEELGISLEEGVIDKETMRRALKCRLFIINYLPSYKYTVICSSYKGKWVLSRHKKRDTWEPQGGHIEAGETPLEGAKRELFEESGILDAEIYPVCDYWGFNPYRCSNGMVFLAVVHSIGELPESEMKEIGVFDELPENLTYPRTSPVFYREAGKLLVSFHQTEKSNGAKGRTCL